MSDVIVLRARVAGLSQRHNQNDPELIDAQQQLKAAMLQRHIDKVVSTAPPLTDDQRSRLAAALLAPLPIASDRRETA